MSLLHLLVGWLALGVAQLAASRISRGEEGLDVAIMLTSKRHVVQYEDEDAAQNHAAQKHVEPVPTNVAGSPVHNKLSGDAAQLEKAASSSSQGQHTGRVVLAHLARMESAVRDAPIAFGMVGIGLVILVAAMTVCVITQQRKDRPELDQRPLKDRMEVWERVVDDSPEAARCRRLEALFQELDDGHAGAAPSSGYITAMDLNKAMQDRRVAAELAQVGILSSRDTMAVFKLMASKSEDGSIHLREFLAGCTSPEGQLMKLFAELDEAKYSEESPPGFINEHDLTMMLSDPRMESRFAALGITSQDSYTVFRVLAGQSGNGFVNLEQFVDGCKKLKSANRRAASVRSGSVYSGYSGGGSGI